MKKELKQAFKKSFKDESKKIYNDYSLNLKKGYKIAKKGFLKGYLDTSIKKLLQLKTNLKDQDISIILDFIKKEYQDIEYTIGY